MFLFIDILTQFSLNIRQLSLSLLSSSACTFSAEMIEMSESFRNFALRKRIDDVQTEIYHGAFCRSEPLLCMR